MKKFIISSLLLCALSVNAQITGPTTGAYIHDGTPEQLLRQARLLYNEGSYDIAEALLQTIETDKLSDTQRREAATMLTVIAYKQDVATALSAIEKYLSSGLIYGIGPVTAKKIVDEFNACMSDDFNTALALSNLFGYFKDIKKWLNAGKTGDLFVALSAAVQIRKTYALLGLFKRIPKEYKAWYEEKNVEDIPADVKAVAEERWAARQNRDWAKSDELRAKLAEMGYAVKDSKTGYELTKN